MFELNTIIPKEREDAVSEQLFEQAALSVTATSLAKNRVAITAFFQEAPQLTVDYDYTLVPYNESAWKVEETVAFHDTRLSCPNVVFGNGEHPTTQLALAAIDDLTTGGETYTTGLDVGAGSGILAFHLAKLCTACHITAVDIDPVSVKTIGENSTRLGLSDRVVARVGDITAGFEHKPVDILLVNLPIAVMEQAVPEIAKLAHQETRIILTGFTEKWIPLMSELLGRLNWKCEEKTAKDGWQLWVC